MENASKALIIAGAILISIVLIAVGVMVVNGANGAIDTAIGSMSDNEKQVFNQKFEPFEGRQKGSSVKSLLSAIITNNARAAEDGSTSVSVTMESASISNTTEESEVSRGKSGIQNSGTYMVEFTYTSGVITGVQITKEN